MTVILSGSLSPQIACLSSSVRTNAVALQFFASSLYLGDARKATSPCPALSRGAIIFIFAFCPLAEIVLSKVSLLNSLMRSTSSIRVSGSVL